MSTITQKDKCTRKVALSSTTGIMGTAKDTEVLSNKCVGLVGALGVFAAIMSLGLIGVVLGWMWSYYKRTQNSSVEER